MLWVDAICINQNDVEEKTKQVAMMGRIFMQASRTVIYLGKADRHSVAMAKQAAGMNPFVDLVFFGLFLFGPLTRSIGK